MARPLKEIEQELLLLPQKAVDFAINNQAQVQVSPVRRIVCCAASRGASSAYFQGCSRTSRQDLIGQ